MKTIYKYELDGATLEVPETAILLTVGSQGRNIVAWYIVNVDAKDDLRTDKLYVYGTGWPMDAEEQLQYVKTIQMDSGLVFHIFIPYEVTP